MFGRDLGNIGANKFHIIVTKIKLENILGATKSHWHKQFTTENMGPIHKTVLHFRSIVYQLCPQKCLNN